MKRFVLMSLLLVFSLLVAGGCGRAPAEEGMDGTPGEPGSYETIGMGVVTSVARSLDYNEDASILPLAQVDNVIVFAAFDGEGRIADLLIDAAQTRVNFDAELQVASDLTAEIKTKKELGADYGMARVSEIGREWDEQIAALESWLSGKTINEVKSLGLTEQGSPEDPDLSTTVTIAVTDYIAALEKAYTSAVPVEPGAQKIGLGHTVSIGRSVSYRTVGDSEILPMAQVDVVIAGAAFGPDGTVHGVLIDTAQTRVNFDAQGLVTSDRGGFYPTKKELGADYGMSRASEIGREWDEQIASFEAWIVGKTIDQAKDLTILDDGSPDEADLLTTVTIAVGDYLAALEEAFNRAR